LDANVISAAALARAFGESEFAPSEEALDHARSNLIKNGPLTPVIEAELAIACNTPIPDLPHSDLTLTELDRLEFRKFAELMRNAQLVEPTAVHHPIPQAT
jgi:hypothetical protein